MGTPEFAVPGLRRLLETSDFDIVAIFTQPDKAVGRKQTITPSPVKQLAQENNVKVYQPDKIKTAVETISALAPDLIVVIAYGKIIPQTILAIPKYACINVHASLLPKYRGAACLNAPILNGDLETGVTIMKMDNGLDTGPILRQSKVSLKKTETLETIHDKLSQLGADILPGVLLDLVDRKIEEIDQDDAQASYIGLLKKGDGKIDWNKSAKEIERMIRALNPWPGTYTEYNDRTIKIMEADNEILVINKYKTGEVFRNNDQLVIQCGQDSLVVLKLQTEGKKAMTDKEFINGNRGFIGAILA